MAKCRLCDGNKAVVKPVCGYSTNYFVTCPHCHGTGEEPNSTCPACGGDGKSKVWYNWGNPCEKCNGSGVY